MLYVVYVGCGFFKLLLLVIFFLMAKEEFLFMLLRLPMCVFIYDHTTIFSFI